MKYYERIIQYLRDNPYIACMIFLTFVLILVKYLLTGCVIVCIEPSIYIDPIDVSEDIERVA